MNNKLVVFLLLTQTIFLYVMWSIATKQSDSKKREDNLQQMQEQPIKSNHGKMPSDMRDVHIKARFYTAVAAADPVFDADSADIAKPNEVVADVQEVMTVDETTGPNYTTIFLMNTPSTLASSIQNILLRKAIDSKLKIALPQPNQDIMCFPMIFER